MKSWKTAFAVLALITVLILAAALLCVVHGQDSEQIKWEYAVDNVLCIGDSLTEGSYFGWDDEPASIQQNYPYYLGRMLNTNVTNAGVAGYSPSDWWKNEAEKYDYSEYDAVIIWLGTNNAPENTLAQDVAQFSSADEYAETETGYYCRIIDRIYEENPDCFVMLINIYASKTDVAEANIAIADIGAHYGLPVLDLSEIGAEEHPEYHAGIGNPHLGKAGNIYVASRVVDELREYFQENPLRCEFGVHKVEH